MIIHLFTDAYALSRQSHGPVPEDADSKEDELLHIESVVTTMTTSVPTTPVPLTSHQKLTSYEMEEMRSAPKMIQ